MKYEDLSRDGAGDVIAGKVKFPVEIGLLRPVAVAGAEIESLTLQQEPTVLDLELCRKTGSEITRMVHLLASLAELSPDEVRALKAADCAGSAEAAGAFLIADQDNSAVRRVDPEGIITSVHFAPPPANGGDEGPAAEAVFVGPLAVEVDGHGNVYVADAGDHRVRKIDSRGAITAVAGTGERVSKGTGDPRERLVSTGRRASRLMEPATSMSPMRQGNGSGRLMPTARSSAWAGRAQAASVATAARLRRLR
ncbi:MAG: phage tail assembly protein [Bryobacterales bacterium]|nr:phage tail assembly protein [Bryobacterales bacterium]MDE0622778.1 phage tail assembly protein [Bryobacterales bacterium]